MRKPNMKKLMKKYLPFVIVILAYITCQVTASAGLMPRTTKSLLVPVCVYIVMAVSLNLTVGISGELSLGHAGFMSVGAYASAVVTNMLAAGRLTLRR